MTTREAFGRAITALGGTHPRMFVLDGDVKNSTFTSLFEEKYPAQFIQCYIAEQNMVGVALGLSRRGFEPWVVTFSAFFTRAHDQIRLSAISGATIRFCGSHAGVSIGADGPSQMGLEDIALFRAVPGSIVLSPCDPNQTAIVVEEMAKTKGIAYIRTMRDVTPVLYAPSDEFPIGGSKVFDAPGATVTIVATGITVHEALKAQKAVKGVRVIDCYSIKPIDGTMLQKAASETKALIVVEDHYPEGGLGDAVKSALAGEQHVPIIHLAVSKMPRSGKPEELLRYEGIDAKAIVEAVKRYG